MEFDSEIEYTQIDSLVYRDANGMLQKANPVDSFWRFEVVSEIKDSIGFQVYGEAKNLHATQILHAVNLKIKGEIEENGNVQKVNKSERLEPLLDTLFLNHGIYYIR
ncbi:MAG: hypothetical protein SchgKO_11740 [Schleiferiaceae bacterium]